MEEVRLIDANALHKRIEMNLHASNPFTIEECCYKDALNSVDEAPTIDPESLRGHAKWVKDKELKFIIVDDENNSHEEPAIRCTHCNPETPDCVLGFGMFFLDTPDDIQRWNSRTDKAKSNPET